MKLVKRKNEIFADSREIATNFQKRHANVLRNISTLIEKERVKIKPDYYIFLKKATIYQGRKTPYYLLNIHAFEILALNFTGNRAFDFKIKYIELFNKMKEDLLNRANNQLNPQWMESRFEGKNIRVALASMIKRLEIFSLDNGHSINPNYFSLLTNALYKIIGIDTPKGIRNYRNTLSSFDLDMVSLGEKIMIESIKEHMEQKLHSKEIIRLVKEDVNKLNSMSISELRELKNKKVKKQISLKKQTTMILF